MADFVWLPDSLTKRLAAQLGNPSGPAGRALGHVLNRANRAPVIGMVDALADMDANVVADIGFGGGLGLQLLLERIGEDGVVLGIDSSPTMVASARRRFRSEIVSGRLRVDLAPMNDLPLADESLDAIVSANTIYYIDDLDACLREVARVLRSTGQFVLGLGDPDFMATLPFTQYGVRLRPLAEVTDHIRSAGLEVTDHRRVGKSDKAFHLFIAKRASINP